MSTLMKPLRTLNSKLVGAVLLVVLLLCGCTEPQPQNLSFETISADVGFRTGRSYSGEAPDFLVITRPEEVDAPGLEIQFHSELAEQLRALDYQRSFVIVLFRGLLSGRSLEYTVDILGVARAGEKVVLRVHLGVPGPGSIVSQAYSSPYHIIAVPKEGKWAQDIHFVLEVDGQRVKEHTYFIP